MFTVHSISVSHSDLLATKAKTHNTTLANAAALEDFKMANDALTSVLL